MGGGGVTASAVRLSSFEALRRNWKSMAVGAYGDADSHRARIMQCYLNQNGPSIKTWLHSTRQKALLIFRYLDLEEDASFGLLPSLEPISADEQLGGNDVATMMARQRKRPVDGAIPLDFLSSESMK